jgi:hypothetical protein
MQSKLGLGSRSDDSTLLLIRKNSRKKGATKVLMWSLNPQAPGSWQFRGNRQRGGLRGPGSFHCWTKARWRCDPGIESFLSAQFLRPTGVGALVGS